MTIIIKMPDKNYADYYKAKTYKLAKIKIAARKVKGAEAKLDDYLMSEYHIGLKAMCFWILNNMTFDSDLNDNLIIRIKNPKLDKIASLITYGNGGIQGSRILRDAISL